uniref:Small ribosomal subunit protein uS10 domain-containing protein n=1 Tax=Chromera velia CCMP2878 TaxID=1169474 RepID=A0A0G4I5B3_9ALVE|mmetsp:Transcript_48244/g.95189  ORF Transcript_48244/g.95189 Transcript_48244/m.95189 type:complete len:253 (+) Transcript_48244:269-1027(+)|eukprot:Cvel_11106.t1-p1 / transcript=Cvel_11106.t1 / gene=Cvel_11106 / organism=Chromera_velia_CCMP2878 / gene_product=hypothetical protein / transcript_product=hypothetical protein / location=Cvel_scaffold687:34093-37308(-) / protein_length=252 / sequence_SO=supercontig / SO=protein_coding / is_pseudo=false
MSLSAYRLQRLRVVYTARREAELERTITNLKSALSWMSVEWPVPKREPRREWRVTYLKSPFQWKRAIRHYVFQDHRYAFSFHDVESPQEVVSAILGAAASSEQVTAECAFSWHVEGRKRKPILEQTVLREVDGGNTPPAALLPPQQSSETAHLDGSRGIEESGDAEEGGDSSSSSLQSAEIDGGSPSAFSRAWETERNSALPFPGDSIGLRDARAAAVKRVEEEHRALAKILRRLEKRELHWFQLKHKWPRL